MRNTVLGVLMALGFVNVISAHHSHAAYDTEKTIEVEGVITDVKWRNPHMWITLAVPTPDGKTESWGFEGSSPASTVASGISREILAVGRKVKIIANRSKDKANLTGLFVGLEENGKVYARGGNTNVREKN